jgi:hypothetical protein
VPKAGEDRIARSRARSAFVTVLVVPTEPLRPSFHRRLGLWWRQLVPASSIPTRCSSLSRYILVTVGRGDASVVGMHGTLSWRGDKLGGTVSRRAWCSRRRARRFAGI